MSWTEVRSQKFLPGSWGTLGGLRGPAASVGEVLCVAQEWVAGKSAPETIVWDLERLLLFQAGFFQNGKLLWVLPWGPDSSRVWRQTPC